jgi:uncharacterized membrane protein
MSGDTRNPETDLDSVRNSDPVEPVPVPREDTESEEAFLELRAESHTGPLPHPKTLAEYDQWIPGTGQAIVDNWLKESQTRRETYRWTAVRIPIIGQVMGFVVVACALVISGYAIHLGQSLVGFGVVFAALASVAGAWIAGRRS